MARTSQPSVSYAGIPDRTSASPVGIGGLIGLCLAGILGSVLVALAIHDYIVNPYLSETPDDKKEVALDVWLLELPRLRRRRFLHPRL